MFGIAIGYQSGNQSQGQYAVSIGYKELENLQGTYGISIGYLAGNGNQGENAIAIGRNAGKIFQSNNSIAIGNYAGFTFQGTACIAIGYLAGATLQTNNSIILNASGTALNSSTRGFYAKPLRTLGAGYVLSYEPTSGEIFSSRGAPVTKTSSFTVGTNENWIICNGAATITVTLPVASASTGREIMFKNTAAQTVVSASANVVPLIGGAAGTALLPNTAGSRATLVSDGTNWIIMQ